MHIMVATTVLLLLLAARGSGQARAKARTPTSGASRSRSSSAARSHGRASRHSVSTESPCKRLEQRLTFDDGVGTHARVLRDCSACLRTLERENATASYYKFVPLVNTRLFQLQIYRWASTSKDARNASVNLASRRAATEQAAWNASVFVDLAARRAALAARMDPRFARPTAKRRAIDDAIRDYRQCARSGRGLAPWQLSRDQDSSCEGDLAGARRSPPNATASLLAHHHMTFHGGTALLTTIQDRTCVLLPRTCAARVVPDRRTRALDLLDVSAPVDRCGDQRCGANFVSSAPDVDAGATYAPVDAVFFEPTMPRRAAAKWIDSGRVVFSTVVRHPAFFAATRGIESGKHSEFMLHMFLDSGTTSNFCHVLPAASLANVRRRAASGAIATPGFLTDCPTASKGAAPPVDTREKLAAAKEILSGFAVVVLAEAYAEGFQSFCRRLRWPDCKVVNKRGHWRPPKPVLDAATRTSAPGRRLGRRPPGAPHHGVVKALDHFNLTPADLAAIVDASQLSTELYFAARELNRADHREFGLEEPPTSLAAPGEFEGLIW